MKVSVLIPALNEENSIEETIQGVQMIPAQFPAAVKWQIIVIDDGSTDKTWAQAARSDVKALRLERNSGKGGALRHGLKQADGDIIVFLDADLRQSSFEAHKLISPLMNGHADVTIAHFRPSTKPGGFGLVGALASAGVKFFTGQQLHSVLSGQRAFKRQVLEDVGHIPDGFSLEVGMLIDILNKGYRVVEVDVDMYHDVTGRDWRGFRHRGKQFVDILKMLVSKLRERRVIA